MKRPDESGSVFQTEIKIWLSNAIKGRTLQVPATAEQLRKYKVARWKQHWDEDRRCPRETKTSVEDAGVNRVSDKFEVSAGNRYAGLVAQMKKRRIDRGWT